ncbi:unnamed protein product [Parajaminaea phylloscopi]
MLGCLPCSGAGPPPWPRPVKCVRRADLPRPLAPCGVACPAPPRLPTTQLSLSVHSAARASVVVEMPDPKLQAYLAQHYLSGPKADAILARSGADADGPTRKKKKKRKRAEGADDTATTASLRVRDDEDSWKRDEDEDGADGAVSVGQETSKSRFAKSSWADIAGEDTPAPPDPEEQPQIVGGTGASDALREAQQAISVADQPEEAAAGPSKPRAGLRTKEQVRAERLAREEAQRAEERALAAKGSGDGDGDGSVETEDDRAARLAQTTVYRDASGRRIDVETEDAAIRAEEERQRRREAEKKDWNRGQKQLQEQRRREQDLRQVESEGVARYATDGRMNEALRAVERADDPALAFLTKKRTQGPRLPTYQGPRPPPNRFGISPGYRWDGVDRGNGFEKRFFEAQGARQRREQDV